MISEGQLKTWVYKEVPKSPSVMSGVRGVYSTVCIAWETRQEERNPASVNGNLRS